MSKDISKEFTAVMKDYVKTASCYTEEEREELLYCFEIGETFDEFTAKIQKYIENMDKRTGPTPNKADQSLCDAIEVCFRELSDVSKEFFKKNNMHLSFAFCVYDELEDRTEQYNDNWDEDYDPFDKSSYE